MLCNFSSGTARRIVFLRFSDGKHKYTVLPARKAYEFLNGGSGFSEGFPEKREELDFSDMDPGDIFFDLDSVWNNAHARRSYVLPELKSRGVRVAVYVYDIIPVTDPQYCHMNTLYNFMDYIGAHLQYADLIITSTRSVMDEIDRLYGKLGIARTAKGAVSWLGSDFLPGGTAMDGGGIRQEVKRAAARRYILAVGTVEPRKNHAYLLDAFERDLFAEGLNLVFVGKTGWNVDGLKERMKSFPHRGERFFWFEKVDDGTLHYLYRNAWFTAFPSFNEGFGLPVVESLQHGTPVMASDIPVMREVGGDRCVYFDNADTGSLCGLAKHYLGHPEEYAELKRRAGSYVPATWKQCAGRIEEALGLLSPRERKPKTDVRQMVFLTARADSVAGTLPFVDRFMPFIEEAVLCCPDGCREEMENCYRGRLEIRVLTDGELLGGRDLPRDHGRRNFMLRCLAMRHGAIDDVFIMSDDDYRPLREIRKDFFVDREGYKGYYFYDVRHWNGTVGHMTSYDRQQFRTRRFLEEHRYPTKQYSAHMPQVIDRRIYLEMLDRHGGIEEEGLDEWSTYFNYAQHRYPGLVRSLPYVTLAWPGNATDWDREERQEEYAFENFYGSLYGDGGIFGGFSEEYFEGIERENERKIRLYRRQMAGHSHVKERYGQYESAYVKKYKCHPSFVVLEERDGISIEMPEELSLCRGGFVRLETAVMVGGPDYEMNWEIHNRQGIPLQRGSSFGGNFRLDVSDLRLTGNRFGLPVDVSENIAAGNRYMFRLVVLKEGKSWSKEIPLEILE